MAIIHTAALLQLACLPGIDSVYSSHQTSFVLMCVSMLIQLHQTDVNAESVMRRLKKNL